jgi:hypothetical protein
MLAQRWQRRPGGSTGVRRSKGNCSVRVPRPNVTGRHSQPRGYCPAWMILSE